MTEKCWIFHTVNTMNVECLNQSINHFIILQLLQPNAIYVTKTENASWTIRQWLDANVVRGLPDEIVKSTWNCCSSSDASRSFSWSSLLVESHVSVAGIEMLPRITYLVSIMKNWWKIVENCMSGEKMYTPCNTWKNMFSYTVCLLLLFL